VSRRDRSSSWFEYPARRHSGHLERACYGYHPDHLVDAISPACIGIGRGYPPSLGVAAVMCVLLVGRAAGNLRRLKLEEPAASRA
jgi:hypothetical protein